LDRRRPFGMGNVGKRKLRFEGVEAFRRVIIRRQEEFGCLLSAYGYRLSNAPLPHLRLLSTGRGEQVIGFAIRRLLI
jgi:hypothetical protein